MGIYRGEQQARPYASDGDEKTMTNSNLVPRITEPISAYDLLTKVCEVITEEPKRYNQGNWVLRGQQIDYENLPMPSCGTVCCVAGWIETLVESPQRAERLSQAFDSTLDHFPISLDAANLLGLSIEDGDELFDSEVLYRLFDDDYEDFDGPPDDFPDRGTPEYAALGVRHIQNFQAKYADQLKAKIVVPVPATTSGAPQAVDAVDPQVGSTTS